MSSKKRKSTGGVSASAAAAPGATSIEEQRKRARLWKEQQLGQEAPPIAPKPEPAAAKKANRRASMSAVEPSARAAAAAKSPVAARPAARASRQSLAPQMLSSRGASPAPSKAKASTSASPPPKRTKTADAAPLTVEQQRDRARQWREENLGSAASSKPPPSSGRRASTGAETVPQAEFTESEIPESLRPSRAPSAVSKTGRIPSTRRASLDSALTQSPALGLRGPAGRVSISGGMSSAARRKKAVTPPYVSPVQESSGEDEDTVPLLPPRRSGAREEPPRASFSAARRSSAGSTSFDESIYSYPADFRHQFNDRNLAEQSSPETAGDLSPLVHANPPTPSTVRSRRGSRRTSSIKKKLMPADSESDEEDVSSQKAGARLSFSQQKERAKRWKQEELPTSLSPSLAGAKDGETAVVEEEDDPNAIEMAEAPEPLAPQKQSLSQMRDAAWLGEMFYFFGGVGLILSMMVLRVKSKDGSGVDFSSSLVPALSSIIPGGRAELDGLRLSYEGAVTSFSDGLELTLTSLRAVSLALLAVAVVFPVVYGIFTMVMWCWKNAQKKSNLIETMADEVKDLLFNTYEGGPYPVVFLMETLMDKYRREGSGKATELLSPGETLNRAAFRKLWPSVEKEVTSDARVEILNRTFEGKIHVCWRVIGGKGTIHSTHIASDFTTDDFGHEDAHSKSGYTPAKVHGSGMSFL